MISRKMQLVREISRRMDVNEKKKGEVAAESEQLEEELRRELNGGKKAPAKTTEKRSARAAPKRTKKAAAKKRQKNRTTKQIEVVVLKIVNRNQNGSTATKLAKEASLELAKCKKIMAKLVREKKARKGKVKIRGRKFPGFLPVIRNRSQAARA